MARDKLKRQRAERKELLRKIARKPITELREIAATC